MTKQCTAIKRNGQRCRRPALKGQDTCSVHVIRKPSAEPLRRATKPDQGWALPPHIYSGVLTPEDQEDLVLAYRMEGLDAEIALFRVLLKRSLVDSPDKPAATAKMMEGLVKALVARHRISGDARAGLDEALSRALTELSNELGIPL